jgi:Flp pilus assembly pilin Flp
MARRAASAARLLRDLLRRDDGQDLVEYALLTAAVALASAAALGLLRTTIGTSYQAWHTATDALWAMPPPGGGS